MSLRQKKEKGRYKGKEQEGKGEVRKVFLLTVSLALSLVTLPGPTTLLESRDPDPPHPPIHSWQRSQDRIEKKKKNPKQNRKREPRIMAEFIGI
jgi:hypothetical protein